MLVPSVAVIIVLTTISLRNLAEAPLVGGEGAGAYTGIQGWALPLASTHPQDPQQLIAADQL